MSTTPQPERRRDVRVVIQIPLTLKWFDSDGKEHEESIQTEVINSYGFLFFMKSKIAEGDSLDVINPSNNKNSSAKIIWSGETDALGRNHVGIELADPSSEFWGEQFVEKRKKANMTDTWVD